MIAALAAGRSVLKGALFSDDTRYMSEALRAVGVGVQGDESASSFVVEGSGGRAPAAEADLFVGNSGTTARFLVSFLALGRGSYRVDGVPRMRQRPIQPLLDALSSLGVRVRSELGSGCPPVVLEADGIAGGRTRLSGSISSQYLTSLLLAAPYMRDGLIVEIEGELVSRPYVDMTLAQMRAFGVRSERDDEYRVFHVPVGQAYTPMEYAVEPDASNASYFFAAAALTGGRVRVEGLGADSLQGDAHFVDVLELMGCTVVRSPEYLEVAGPERLRGVSVNLNSMSDTVQTLAAIAPFAAGPVKITGVGHIRDKETDRISAVATELRRMGVRVEEFDDGLTIYPSEVRPAEIETYDDHRMAMSFAVAGLRAPGVKIKDPECVNKTFPGYFAEFDALTGGR